MEQRIAAKDMADRSSNSFQKWEVRDGFPFLSRVDESGMRADLLNGGYTATDVDNYMAAVLSPKFNERNRRGFERLQQRVLSCKRIAAALWGDRERYLERLPVGVAWVPYLNAGAFPVPGGGDAILLNMGLSYMYDYYICFDQMGNALYKDPTATVTIIKLARAVFGSRTDRVAFVTAFPRSLAADSSASLSARIQMAMGTLFVLLHEYGHIALGHTSEFRKWERDALLTEPDLKARRLKQREWEYEADAFAFDVLSGKRGNAGAPAPGEGFRNNSVGRFFGLLGLGTEPSDVEYLLRSHPTGRERMFRLLGLSNEPTRHELECAMRGSGADDNDRFVNELLKPLLEQTGAISSSPPDAGVV